MTFRSNKRLVLTLMLPVAQLLAACTLPFAAMGPARVEQVDAPSVAEAGVGYDPLTEAETAQALSATAALQGVQAAAMRSAVVGAVTISAPVDEVVLVERHLADKGAVAATGGGRQADLFIYRYGDDVLVHAQYDFATDVTTIIEEARGVQLPLTDGERALATTIAFSDPALFEWMEAEHHRATGEELLGPEQVEVRAFVYHSGAAPETEPSEAASCGLQRCAQLLILTENNVTYSSLPIVNLSTLRTASVVPLAVSDAAIAGDAHDDHGAGDDAHSHAEDGDQP